MNISERIKEVLERIKKAALGVGKTPKDITLVAVSKKFSPEMIMEAYSCGIRDFGENYIQEALDKIPHLPEDITWHFIGHLQKNKVRKAVRNFALIQSVDSVDLLKRIDRISAEENKTSHILLQVNIAGEVQKGGASEDELKEILQFSEKCLHVIIEGLMLLPPFYEDPERNRPNFRKLKNIFDWIENQGFSRWRGKYLSMGMTDDFEIAIEEGANMVRIGRAIFGPRRGS